MLSEEESYIKGIEWAQERQLTMATLLLAAFFGIFQILSSDTFTLPYLVLYLLIDVGISYLIPKFVDYSVDIANCRYWLSHNRSVKGLESVGVHRPIKEKSIFIKLFLKKDEKRLPRRSPWYRNNLIVTSGCIMIFILLIWLLADAKCSDILEIFAILNDP